LSAIASSLPSHRPQGRRPLRLYSRPGNDLTWPDRRGVG